MTEFCLSDGAFPSLAAEGTALRCKKELCICGMSGPLGLMCERFLVSCLPVASTWVLSGYHADTPITIKAEASSKADSNIH